MENKKLKLIDANEFLVLVKKNAPYLYHMIAPIVCLCPTVDAVEVVHGRWIMDKLEIGNPYDGNSTMIADIGNCSCCGYRCEMLPIMNYCPNCGAKMDGDGNG